MPGIAACSAGLAPCRCRVGYFFARKHPEHPSQGVLNAFISSPSGRATHPLGGGIEAGGAVHAIVLAEGLLFIQPIHAA